MNTKIANNSICPVCGKRVKLVEIESDPEDGPGMGWSSWQVQCHKCGAKGPYDRFNTEYALKKYAIDGWNILIGNTKEKSYANN